MPAWLGELSVFKLRCHNNILQCILFPIRVNSGADESSCCFLLLLYKTQFNESAHVVRVLRCL